MLLFRIAHLATINKFVKILLIPYLIFYRIIIEWILGVELQFQVKADRNLKIWHGQGLVVHKSTIIGANCTLRQGVTIGNKKNPDGSKSAGAVLGDNIDVGANVVIIGSIKIASNCIIGAGTIVTKSFEKPAIIAGNPAKVLKYVN